MEMHCDINEFLIIVFLISSFELLVAAVYSNRHQVANSSPSRASNAVNVNRKYLQLRLLTVSVSLIDRISASLSLENRTIVTPSNFTSLIEFSEKTLKH